MTSKKKKTESKKGTVKMVDLQGFTNILASLINHLNCSISNPKRPTNSKTLKYFIFKKEPFHNDRDKCWFSKGCLKCTSKDKTKMLISLEQQYFKHKTKT